MKPKALIIEDEDIMRITLEDSLRTEGFEVHSYGNGTEGIRAFREKEYSIVVTDVRLPDMSGLEITKKIREMNDDVQVIVMTAFGSIKDAVEAMKNGAFDYITKPFSLDEFNITAARALDIRQMKEENIRLRRNLSECCGFPKIVGESVEIKKVFELIDKVARTDSSILILGESGTGKELVASTIHYQSSRKEKPFIKVNCAALPENLIESELFGYEKGAFTGALKTKPGRFELADGGTIFLDEVGDLPSSTQVKLLRVLQDGSFERLGGTENFTVDVRVISATNRNIARDLKQGKFREDLYYRLNVIPFNIPPLRKRKDDIPLLVEHFVDKIGKKVKFTSGAVSRLMAYSFPGNVRELENIIERCVVLSDNSVIRSNDIPFHILSKNKEKYPVLKLSEITSEAEKEHILRIIRTTKGNRTRAAEILGISRKTLWDKMNSYSIKG